MGTTSRSKAHLLVKKGSRLPQEMTAGHMMTTGQLVLRLRAEGIGEATEIGTAKGTDRQAITVEVGAVIGALEAVVEASEEIDHHTMEGRLAVR